MGEKNYKNYEKVRKYGGSNILVKTLKYWKNHRYIYFWGHVKMLETVEYFKWQKLCIGDNNDKVRKKYLLIKISGLTKFWKKILEKSDINFVRTLRIFIQIIKNIKWSVNGQKNH